MFKYVQLCFLFLFIGVFFFGGGSIPYWISINLLTKLDDLFRVALSYVVYKRLSVFPGSLTEPSCIVVLKSFLCVKLCVFTKQDYLLFPIFPQALGFLYASGLGVNSSQAKVMLLKSYCILDLELSTGLCWFTYLLFHRLLYITLLELLEAIW